MDAGSATSECSRRTWHRAPASSSSLSVTRASPTAPPESWDQAERHSLRRLRPDILVVDLASGAVVDGEYQPSSRYPDASPSFIRRCTSRWHRAHPFTFATSVGPGVPRDPVPRYDTCRPLPRAVPVTRRSPAPRSRATTSAATGDVIIEPSPLWISPAPMPAVLVASHGPFTWGADVGRRSRTRSRSRPWPRTPTARLLRPGWSRSETSCYGSTSRANMGPPPTTASRA